MKIEKQWKITDFNPYKRKDAELDQQTRKEENGEKKNRWIDLDDRFRRMTARRGFLIPTKNTNNNEDEKYKVFDTTKWSGSKT